MAMSQFRLALLQLGVTTNKSDNIKHAVDLISKAAKQGAQLLVLPECCNSPYGNQYFGEYAEEIPGESTENFSKAAADNAVYLIAGSIPERQDGKLYNTSTVFSPTGKLIAKHRKVHLFDIDVPGKMTFQESKTLTAGNNLTLVETSLCKIGLGICYDIRFAEMAQIYGQQGCQLLVYPGAFNMTTGPAHWELLLRARAIDNQCYVAGISPAHDATASYNAWGHSALINPWGEVAAHANLDEEIVYADIDLNFMNEVRKMIPITAQRRHDLYQVQSKLNL